MTICACGCGQTTAGGTFAPGHDQKLRAEIESRAGGLLALARLMDELEEFVAARVSLEHLGETVRTLVHPTQGE